jgi:hypothetical protein
MTFIDLNRTGAGPFLTNSDAADFLRLSPRTFEKQCT